MTSADTTPHYLYRELISLFKPSLFDFIQEGSLDGIWYWDLSKQKNMWISPRFWHSLGYRPDDMGHFTSEWRHNILQEDFNTMMEKLKRHLQDPDYPFNQVIRYEHKSGSTLYMRTKAMAIRGKSGKPLRILAFNNNITTTVNLQESNRDYKERIEYLEKALLREATHDELTNAYNRRGLEEHYKYLIEVAKRDGSHLSVALFHIHTAIEKYGEKKRDEILKEFATVLYQNTRKVDILGRFLDEEFMLLMPNTNRDNSLMVIQRLQEQLLQNPVQEVVELKFSVGIATKSLNLADDTQSTYDILNLYVDEALHIAKKEEYSNIIHYQQLHSR
jgi:diguanylate cyclase (GGDEF)-like protein/PAS domain S-box-containing protein